jgi:hypothetical protein
MRRIAGSVVILIATVTAALGAAPELVGSWVLECGDAGCVLRHKDRLFARVGVSADLEVRAAGEALVPVIAVRGLPNEMLLASSMAGKAEASVQLAGGARAVLACVIGGGGFICAPAEDAVAALAAGLPSARSVAVRVTLSVSGTNLQTSQERTLALAQTPEALARLRAVGAPSDEPGGWARLLDRGMKAAGYKNGAADLPGVVAGYLGR